MESSGAVTGANRTEGVDMGKACAWCGTGLQPVAESGMATTSHALCRGCLAELQSALSSNGLRTAADERRRSAGR